MFAAVLRSAGALRSTLRLDYLVKLSVRNGSPHISSFTPQHIRQHSTYLPPTTLMKILVINTWSSTLKYRLFQADKDFTVLAKWFIDRVSDFSDAVQAMLTELTTPWADNFSISLNEIDAIGHRVVHGWEYFKEATLVDESVKAKIKTLVTLAPLHNKNALLGIQATEQALPWVPNIVVFDTAFHQTMQPERYLYAIPYKYYEQYKIRRYGAHGISHKYVSIRAAELLERPLEELKLITCHIGNGASITAIDWWKVIDTSMGFTPLAGLMMGTRSGDIDPAIIPFLMDQEWLTAEQIDNMLNKQSGLLGVSELSGDMREIIKAHEAWNPRATLAIEMYTNRIVSYIWTYVAELWGCDAIIFTAGTLENSPFIRKIVVDKLDWLGIKLDESNNDFEAEERVISTNDSIRKLLVIPTNEELMIAKEVKETTN